jgi:hypothetical protein
MCRYRNAASKMKVGTFSKARTKQTHLHCWHPSPRQYQSVKAGDLLPAQFDEYRRFLHVEAISSVLCIEHIYMVIHGFKETSSVDTYGLSVLLASSTSRNIVAPENRFHIYPQH